MAHSADDKSSLVSPLTLRSTLQLIGLTLGIIVVGYGGVALSLWLIPGLRVQGVSILAWTISIVPLILIVAVGNFLRYRRISWQMIGFRRPTPRLFHLLWQIPVMFLVLLIVQALVSAIFQTQPVAGENGTASLFGAISPLAVVALAIGVGVLTPFWEELIFRGVIYGGLRRRLSAWPGVLLAGVIFAAVHGYPILLPYMLTVGVSLVLLYQFHRTLWASFIAHAAINCFVVTITLITLLK